MEENGKKKAEARPRSQADISLAARNTELLQLDQDSKAQRSCLPQHFGEPNQV
jgi:hypothetical protein